MKEYLELKITTKDGTTFDNPLKLGEIVLLAKILKENTKVEIRRTCCTAKKYKAIFG